MTDVENRTDAITITVDGKAVEAHQGEMIIAAAERAGVYIPRFCYHPRMRPVGMCRMCMVEVVGPRGPQLQPACYVPVADGQEVITQSDTVKRVQDGVLELLLVNHPLDCPVCDKGGECPLQDQTLVYGPGETRFVEEKRHWEKPIALSDLVYIDRERCIQCDRCTRFADEVAGDPLIEFVGRGGHTEVNTFPDEPFASYFSGNTVQICPVGALLARPYRFKARPWDLEQVESTCTVCSVGCRIAVQSSNDQLTRYLGLDSDPVNHGWLCDKGRFSYEAVNSDERLSEPLVRRNGELEVAGWGEALDEAAESIRSARDAAGAESVAVIGGARLPNEDAYAWAKLAKAVIGTDSVDAQLGDGLPAEVVLGLPRATIDDAVHADAIVLLAPDIKEELPVLYLRLRSAAVDSKIPLFELTPQATGLSRYATSLSYQPGQAGALARALAGDESKDAAGVAAPLIDSLRYQLRNCRVVAVLGRPSLAEPAATIADAALTLARAYPELKFLPALRRGNVHGALDMGLAPGLLPGRVTLDAGRDWYSTRWPGIPGAAGRDTARILKAAADGEIRTLVLLGADPIRDFPDRRLAEAALERAQSVIAVDCFRTESSARADVVLPAAMFGERPGTTTNLEGRITRLGQKITAPGLARPDWMIAVELAARLGSDLGFMALNDITDEIASVAPSHIGIDRALLGSSVNRDGVVAPLSGERDISTWGVTATDSGAGSTAPVGDGVIDPMATPGIDAVEDQGEPATAVAPRESESTDSEPDPGLEDTAEDGVEEPPSTEPREHPPALVSAPESVVAVDIPPPDAYALRLATGRKLYDRGTWVERSPSLDQLVAEPVLVVNPSDLERLGVASGGQVRMRAFEVTAIVTVETNAAVPRGAAFLPFNGPAIDVGQILDSDRPVTDITIETP